MGARIESFPIPAHPSRRWNWLVAAVIAASVAVAGASFLASRGSSDQAAAPAQVSVAKGALPAITGTGPGLAAVANAQANLTGHSLVYFTGAGSNPQVLGRGRLLADNAARLAPYWNSGSITGTGPALAELRGVDVIGITGSGPGLVQIAGNGGGNLRPSDTCRRISRGPC